MNNIYLFHGENNFLSQEKVKNWKKLFAEKYGDTATEVYEAKKIDWKNFSTNLQALPFLAEKKLVILKNIFAEAKEDLKKKLAEEIEKVPDFCILVFYETGKADKRLSLYKKIKQKGEIEEFGALKPAELLPHLKKIATKNKVNIAGGLLYKLIEHCGTDLHQLNNELKKLAHLKLEEPISEKDIQLVCKQSLESSIFSLTDQIAAKNNKAATKTLDKLIKSGEAPLMIFHMIVRQFRILTMLNELSDKNYSQKEIASITKLHPFVVKKTIGYATKFSFQKLKEIYKALLEFDTKIKTGKIRSDKTNLVHLHLEQLLLECSS